MVSKKIVVVWLAILSLALPFKAQTADSPYTLVVMSNYDPPSAEKVARQIRGWLAKV